METKKPYKEKIILTKQDIRAIHAAKDIIKNNPRKHLIIAAIAKQVHINELKLKYGFKQLYGMGLFTYLTNIRMNHARKMLRKKDVSVKQVAIDSGYKFISNFITAFKRKFGYTPGSLKTKELR